MKAVILLEDEFEWAIPGRNEWLGDNCKYPPTDGITCYTDGSKNELASGAGYYCELLRLKESFSTGSIATVHQSELFAISELCDNKSIKTCIDKKIVICTDSQSAIEAVISPLVKSKLVFECKQRLNKLGAQNKVTLMWVPGHEGIQGNEIADELARQGAEKEFIGPEPKFGISMTTRKRIVKVWLRKEHIKAWTNYEGAKHTKIFCGTPSKKINLALLNLSRNDIKRVVEVVTNHCSLNKYLFDIKCEDSPKCLCSHGDETGLHIISECPRYRLFRKKILGKPELVTSDLRLGNLDINKLTEFLKKTKRLP